MPAKNKRLTRTLTFISQKIKLKEFIDEKTRIHSRGFNAFKRRFDFLRDRRNDRQRR